MSAIAKGCAVAALLGLICGTAYGMPPMEEMPDNNASLGGRINQLKPVFVLVITKDGQDYLLTCKAHSNKCTENDPGDLVSEVLRTYTWEKRASKSDDDPCIYFRDVQGNEEKRCW